VILVADAILTLLVWTVTHKPKAPASGLAEQTVDSYRIPPKRAGKVPMLHPGWTAVWVILALTTLACTAMFAVQQSAGNERQAEAIVVRGTVAHIGHDQLTVQVQGGPDIGVDVFDPSHYELGGELPIWVDDAGLARPVSEPYDVTGWLFLAALAGGVMVALNRWVLGEPRARRQLLRRPQTVRKVLATTMVDQVAIATPKSGTVLMIRPHRFLRDVNEVSALLYGVPEPGEWCAVQVGRELIIPMAPTIAAHDPAYELFGRDTYAALVTPEQAHAQREIR
jgi:hypothetical protein